MTTDSSENGATTTSRVNFSGYVGHVTIELVECLQYCMPFCTAG